MRLFIIRFFLLLGLFSPMLATAQVASYAGDYSGTYSGGDNGTWAVTVSTTGVVTGAGHSNLSGFSYSISGQASSSGSLAMTAGSASSGATFAGSINLATGAISGTWSNSYYGVSGTFTGTGTVSKASQTIGTISFSPTALTVGGATTASATATSGLAVSFSSTTPGICTVSGSTVTGVAAGACTVAANQAGNASYNAATQVTQNISVITQVSLSPASLTFTNQSIGITSTAKTVTLTNPGAASLNITGITASSDFAQTNNCGASVAAGAGCTLTITSTPTVEGVRTGTVTITSNAASSPSIINVVSVPAGTLSFVSGWNLVGNSVDAPLTVAATFGDAAKVTTVWKWMPATSKWAFYTPQQTDGGAAYAATKGYDFLSTINGGEGFWVNAKAAFTAQLSTGTSVGTSYFQDQLDPAQNKLLKGWNLVAMGDNVTPSLFNQALSVTPPAQGVIPLNVITLWAWDSGLSNWYFYAPSLEASGGLANYIASKNYLDFAQHNKTLGQGVGFWVNKP